MKFPFSANKLITTLSQIFPSEIFFLMFCESEFCTLRDNKNFSNLAGLWKYQLADVFIKKKKNNPDGKEKKKQHSLRFIHPIIPPSSTLLFQINAH